jgi:hypothetical protein
MLLVMLLHMDSNMDAPEIVLSYLFILLILKYLLLAVCVTTLTAYVRFEVSMAVRMMMFFWVLVPCKLVGRCQCYRETYCLHLSSGVVTFVQAFFKKIKNQCVVTFTKLKILPNTKDGIIR